RSSAPKRVSAGCRYRKFRSFEERRATAFYSAQPAYNKQPVPERLRNGLFVFSPQERSVSHLRHDSARFVDFAIRALRHKSGVGSSAESQRSRRHHPRFHEHIGIVDGDFVKDLIALTRESLYD